MKIGIDIRSLMDREYSGVPEYTMNLLHSLFKIDKENEYKLFYNSWHEPKKNFLEFEFENVKIVRTAYPNKIFNFVFQKFLKIPKIDQMLQVDLFFMPNIGFTALKGTCKSVITIHDLSFIRYPDFFSFKRKLWHRVVNIKKFLVNFEKIIAVSQHTKNDLINIFGIDEKRIRVIYSAIGNDFYEIDEFFSENKKTSVIIDEVRAKYNLPEKYILSLVTIEPRKNIESIIEAYELFILNNPQYSDIYLVIAGTEGWKKGRILKTLKKSKLRNKIKLIGYVDKNDKKNLYNLAQLFVYVSYYEGFGFPPVEAMASKCPVVLAGNSSLAEVVGEVALMVDSFKVSEIELAIKLVLTNKEYKKDLILRAYNWSKKFSWKQSAKEYLALFKDLKNSHNIQ